MVLGMKTSMSGWREAGSLAAALALAGCATTPPDVPNPAGLPPDALSFAYVLNQACIPYMLGNASEAQVTQRVGMRRFKLYSFPDPPPDIHQYVGRYPGVSALNFDHGSCGVHVIGHRTGDYRRAVERVFARRFGADYATKTVRGPPLVVPGQVQFCIGRVRYEYYPTYQSFQRRPGEEPSGYDVYMSPSDCERWR